MRGPIFLVSNQFDSLVVFRGALIRALVDRGDKVWCIAPDAPLTDLDYCSVLESWGAQVFRIKLFPGSVLLFRDLPGILRLRDLWRRERPQAVFSYTIKPNIYCGLLARSFPETRQVALMNGLGFAFLGRSIVARAASVVAQLLYRAAFSRSDRVLFHNQSDRDYFIAKRMVQRAKTIVVPGSGVDTAEFCPLPLPSGHPMFLMASRLVREKGVIEFLEASREVKRSHPEIRFVLAGSKYDSPSAIPQAIIERWSGEGVGEYRPAVQDLRPLLAEAAVVVLPSYREGMSRLLIEALACGRAIITCDVPGCREAVVDGTNGLLIPPRDVTELARAMTTLAFDRRRIEEMGQRGREIATERFQTDKVVGTVLSALGLTAEQE